MTAPLKPTLAPLRSCPLRNVGISPQGGKGKAVPSSPADTAPFPYELPQPPHTSPAQELPEAGPAVPGLKPSPDSSPARLRALPQSPRRSPGARRRFHTAPTRGGRRGAEAGGARRSALPRRPLPPRAPPDASRRSDPAEAREPEVTRPRHARPLP